MMPNSEIVYIEERKLCSCGLYQDIINPTCYGCGKNLNTKNIVERHFNKNWRLIEVVRQTNQGLSQS